MTEVKTVTVTPAQGRFMAWASDVLVYTVVLNPFVEYADAIIITRSRSRCSRRSC